MDDREVLVLIPARIRDLFLVQSLQTGSEVHRTSYSVSTRSCFTWVKRLVYKTDHWIPHHSEIKIERSYASNRQTASWAEQGQFFKVIPLYAANQYISLKTVVVTLTYKIQKIKESYTNRRKRRNHFYCNLFSSVRNNKILPAVITFLLQ